MAIERVREEANGSKMGMVQLLERAKKQLAEVTGLKPVSGIKAFRNDQGWHFRVEMLEMTRIPSSTDVLGDYDALLGEDGSLLAFERKRTRLRGEAVEEDE